MSDIRVAGHTTPTPTAEGGWTYPLTNRIGAAIGSSETAYLRRAGYCFTTNIGAFSTGIAGGGAGTILDLDQPEGLISVPSGTTIELILAKVQCQVPLLATDADEAEILVAIDRAAAWVGTGTATSEVALNMRTDNPRESNCTVRSAFTADITGTAPTLGIEVARKVITGDIQSAVGTTWGFLDLDYEPSPDGRWTIVGPGCIYVYWGGTVAVPGFAQVSWVEYPSGLQALFSAV